MTTPIVFFGNERIATGVHTDTPVLKSLISAGYNVVAIVSNYERGKSRNVRDLEIASVAKEHNIPLFLPEKISEISEQLSELNATAGVLVAYGKIIPQAIIDIFPKGIVNIHPSLLPLHRGPIPIESVILDGSSKTGVSLMKLAKAMDAGDIYAQHEILLSGNETKQQLADDLLQLGSRMLLETLPTILDGSNPGVAQADNRATYDQRITKTDGDVDFTKPADRLEREVRAYADWPKSRTILADKEIVIITAHVINGTAEPGKLYKNAKEVGFYTSNGILIIDALKPAGKGTMSMTAFLAGNPLT